MTSSRLDSSDQLNRYRILVREKNSFYHQSCARNKSTRGILTLMIFKIFWMFDQIGRKLENNHGTSHILNINIYLLLSNATANIYISGVFIFNDFIEFFLVHQVMSSLHM